MRSVTHLPMPERLQCRHRRDRSRRRYIVKPAGIFALALACGALARYGKVGWTEAVALDAWPQCA